MPHLWALILTVLIGIIYNFDNRREIHTKIYLFIIWLAITAVGGLRSLDTLTDTTGYHWMYTSLTQYGLADYISYTGYDFAYFTINWICAKIGIPWQLYLLAVEGFVFASVTLWVKKNSRDPIFSMVLFECLYMGIFEMALRQGMGMAFLLLGYDALNDRKKIRAIILFALGCLSHLTGIVFMVFLVLRRIKLTDKVHLALWITVVLSYVFSPWFLAGVNIIGGALGRNQYLEFYKQKPTNLRLLTTTLLVLAFVFRRQIQKRFEDSGGYYFALYFMLAFLALGGGVITRLAAYYGMFICFLLPEMFAVFKERKLVSIMASLALLGIYIPSSGFITEYRFFWQ